LIGQGKGGASATAPEQEEQRLASPLARRLRRPFGVPPVLLYLGRIGRTARIEPHQESRRRDGRTGTKSGIGAFGLTAWAVPASA
jgi:hypothetical protein